MSYLVAAANGNLTSSSTWAICNATAANDSEADMELLDVFPGTAVDDRFNRGAGYRVLSGQLVESFTRAEIGKDSPYMRLGQFGRALALSSRKPFRLNVAPVIFPMREQFGVYARPMIVSSWEVFGVGMPPTTQTSSLPAFIRHVAHIGFMIPEEQVIEVAAPPVGDIPYWVVPIAVVADQQPRRDCPKSHFVCNAMGCIALVIPLELPITVFLAAALPEPAAVALLNFCPKGISRRIVDRSSRGAEAHRAPVLPPAGVMCSAITSCIQRKSASRDGAARTRDILHSAGSLRSYSPRPRPAETGCGGTALRGSSTIADRVAA